MVRLVSAVRFRRGAPGAGYGWLAEARRYQTESVADLPRSSDEAPRSGAPLR